MPRVPLLPPSVPCPLHLGWCGGASLEPRQGQPPRHPKADGRYPHLGLEVWQGGGVCPGLGSLAPPLPALPGTGSPVVEQAALLAPWLCPFSCVYASGGAWVVCLGSASGGGTPHLLFWGDCLLASSCRVLVGKGEAELPWAPVGVSLLRTEVRRGWPPLGLGWSLPCWASLAESPWPWPRGYRIINRRLFPRLEADPWQCQCWEAVGRERPARPVQGEWARSFPLPGSE